jgi:hypothetical protein
MSDARIAVHLRNLAKLDKQTIPMVLRYVAAIIVILLVAAYLIALVSGGIPPNARIDFAAIVLVLVAAAVIVLLFSTRSSSVVMETLTRVRAVQFASLKVELEDIRARQDDQTSRLELIQLLAPLILSEPERKHLLNLYHRKTVAYVGNHEVRTELRRLRYLTLITNTRPVGSATDGATFDLGQLAQLTALGTRWAQQLEDMEKPRGKSEVG